MLEIVQLMMHFTFAEAAHTKKVKQMVRIPHRRPEQCRKRCRKRAQIAFLEKQREAEKKPINATGFLRLLTPIWMGVRMAWSTVLGSGKGNNSQSFDWIHARIGPHDHEVEDRHA